MAGLTALIAAVPGISALSPGFEALANSTGFAPALAQSKMALGVALSEKGSLPHIKRVFKGEKGAWKDLGKSLGSSLGGMALGMAAGNLAGHVGGETSNMQVSDDSISVSPNNPSSNVNVNEDLHKFDIKDPWKFNEDFLKAPDVAHPTDELGPMAEGWAEKHSVANEPIIEPIAPAPAPIHSPPNTLDNQEFIDNDSRTGSDADNVIQELQDRYANTSVSEFENQEIDSQEIDDQFTEINEDDYIAFEPIDDQFVGTQEEINNTNETQTSEEVIEDTINPHPKSYEITTSYEADGVMHNQTGIYTINTEQNSLDLASDNTIGFSEHNEQVIESMIAQHQQNGTGFTQEEAQVLEKYIKDDQLLNDIKDVTLATTKGVFASEDNTEIKVETPQPAETQSIAERMKALEEKMLAPKHANELLQTPETMVKAPIFNSEPVQFVEDTDIEKTAAQEKIDTKQERIANIKEAKENIDNNQDQKLHLPKELQVIEDGSYKLSNGSYKIEEDGHLSASITINHADLDQSVQDKIHSNDDKSDFDKMKNRAVQLQLTTNQSIYLHMNESSLAGDSLTQQESVFMNQFEKTLDEQGLAFNEDGKLAVAGKEGETGKEAVRGGFFKNRIPRKGR